MKRFAIAARRVWYMMMVKGRIGNINMFMQIEDLKHSFEHKLIVGKITELIFELMFRETHKFSVFRFGYEYTEEYLAQYRRKFPKVVNDILHRVGSSPDFVLVTEDKDRVDFVEVKYCSTKNDQTVLKIANDTLDMGWNPCHIFLVSEGNFYFDTAYMIKKNMGKIEILKGNWVSQKIQDKYKKLADHWLWQHKD